MTTTAVRPPAATEITGRVTTALTAFLDRQAGSIRAVSPALEPTVESLYDALLNGGKRLRPAFCYWGWRAAGGDPDEPGIIAAASALELLHACALIHDDIMDGSDTRRGRPSMHRRFATLHGDSGFTGNADTFGTAAAILLGDWCLSWCDEMFDACGLDWQRVRPAKELFHLMHTEVIAGQYLDMLEQAAGGGSVERARTVIRYKTAKYTVERPMQLGGLLAGAAPGLLESYSDFALPLGEAFQLRDDVLGVFGDPAVTGKPAGDDLREGKPTVMMALTRERLTPRQLILFDGLLGDPALDAYGVEQLRALIVGSGALAVVEEQIEDYARVAQSALRGLPVAADARGALSTLADAAVRRAR